MPVNRTKVLISPSLTSAIDVKYRDWLTLERETPAGATLENVLKELSLTYPELGRMLFDREKGGVSEEIILVLNGHLLLSPDAAAIGVRDGDTLVILPTYTGG
jgi:molybdopterin converting factor small subunit